MAHQGRKSADDVLLLTLACGSTVESAAVKAGISARTVYRRLKDPEFKRRVAEVRADMVQRMAGMLTAASGESVKTMLALQDPSTPPAVRLGAARATIELGIKLRDSADLAERIAALEAQVSALKPPAP
jgi:hypothetical protein